FLPRGLFNACPHALSLAHGFVVEGRRQTNLNELRRSPGPQDKKTDRIAVGEGFWLF
ncbi:hypothetical protein P3T43_006985, partial [Paraburkholderia sp. GAS41]